MIAVDKSKVKVPDSLTDKVRQKAYIENAEKGKYVSGDKYKTIEVQDTLNELYNKKCAYCEDTLLNSPKHTEHYRPKNSDDRKNCDSSHSYFWLAFSWDNLLLACTSCNSAKGSCFDIKGKRVDFSDYKEYTLSEVQFLINEFDAKEQPMLINPEQVSNTFLKQHLQFNFEGKILSENERLEYTIRVCRLNRDELVKKRILIMNDLKEEIKCKKHRFKIHKNQTQYKNDLKDIAKSILARIEQNREFSAWQNFLIRNLGTIERQITV